MRADLEQVHQLLRVYQQKPPPWWSEAVKALTAPTPPETGAAPVTETAPRDTPSSSPESQPVASAGVAAIAGPPRQALLRFESGAIYQLRALTEISVGRAKENAWRVFITPRSPQNDRRSSLISRKHLRLTYNGAGFTVEDVGSTASTRRGAEVLLPHAAAQLRDGDEISLGGGLTLMACFFADTDRRSFRPYRKQDERALASAGPLAAPLLIGERAPGCYRSVLLLRVDNRPEERCLWLIKRALLGSDRELCEVVVPGAPEVVAALGFFGAGFGLQARVGGIQVGGAAVPVGGKPRVLRAGARVTFPGGAEAVFLERPPIVDSNG